MSLAPVALAQQPKGELVLVPLLLAKVPGAHGSVWSSELRINNSSSQKIAFGELACTFGTCAINDVPALGSGEPLVANPGYPRPYPGTFLVFDKTEIPFLTFSARVYDESRIAQDWGASLPIVLWSKVTPQTLRFPGIPLSSQFRHTLRVYAVSERSPSVTVSYFNDELPASTSIAVQRISLHTFYFTEAYFETSLTDPSAFPSVERIRIEIVADDPELPIWGMVSTTSNESQAVTIHSAPN